jgi:hypothetical protein
MTTHELHELENFETHPNGADASAWPGRDGDHHLDGPIAHGGAVLLEHRAEVLEYSAGIKDAMSELLGNQGRIGRCRVDYALENGAQLVDERRDARGECAGRCRTGMEGSADAG